MTQSKKITVMEALKGSMSLRASASPNGGGADVSAQWDGEQALTFEALARQAIEQHERIRILEEWIQETITAWDVGDIQPSLILHGRFLVSGSRARR